MDATQRAITKGMNVYSSDGEKLGKVINAGGTRFEIEKGFFFPKDYLVNYSDVSVVKANDVYLSFTRDRLRFSSSDVEEDIPIIRGEPNQVGMHAGMRNDELGTGSLGDADVIEREGDAPGTDDPFRGAY